MPLLPLYDDNPRLHIANPWTTWGLIIATAAVFLLQNSDLTNDLNTLFGYGFVSAVFFGQEELPDVISGAPAWLTPITYQFLHGSWWHLIGNLLFLWVFGDNVEDAMGHLRFLVFYLLSGALAAVIPAFLSSPTIAPLIGASGAVSGVLGAYLILHPKARVLVPIFVIPIFLPAWVLLLSWFGLQFVALANGDIGVAWLSHITGFLAGLVLVVPFRRGSPLFGRADLPGGITTRDRQRQDVRDLTYRRGPWG